MRLIGLRGAVSDADAEVLAGAVHKFAGGGLAPPWGEGCVELADVVQGAGGSDASEDVNGPVADLKALVEISDR